MFESLSNGDISAVIDELIGCLGVREEIPFDNLLSLLQEKDIQGCVQEIATQLGLPVRVILSYVPKDFRPKGPDRFETTALARTDWTGRGVENIVAQVAVPEHLPTFGTSRLQGYPIQVRVTEGCHESPETFVAIMAHELSHVLLASLNHPQKDSELYVDLVPIILGFRDVVRKGRKTVQSVYGYLTDSQFDFACSYVRDILKRHEYSKNSLIDLAAKLRHTLHTAVRGLSRFRDFLEYLDTHPTRKMRKEDAWRIVQFHACDYTRDWEIGVTQARASLEKAERFTQSLNHYTSSTIERLEEHRKCLALASEQIEQIVEGITEDVKTLRKYVPLFPRLKIERKNREEAAKGNTNRQITVNVPNYPFGP